MVALCERRSDPRGRRLQGGSLKPFGAAAHKPFATNRDGCEPLLPLGLEPLIQMGSILPALPSLPRMRDCQVSRACGIVASGSLAGRPDIRWCGLGSADVFCKADPGTGAKAKADKPRQAKLKRSPSSNPGPACTRHAAAIPARPGRRDASAEQRDAPGPQRLSGRPLAPFSAPKPAEKQKEAALQLRP